MSSRKLRKYKSWLRTLERTEGISSDVSATIETSPVQKQDIAKSLKMKYVTFWRKVSTNKLTISEMKQIINILMKAEVSENKKK